MKKAFLVTALLVALSGCGGGSGGDSSSPPPSGGTNPPPVTSADFPIKTTTLARYGHGDYVNYTGRLKFRGNDTYQAFDYAITVRDGFSLSPEPMQITMTDGSIEETLKKSRVITTEKGEVITENNEVIQFKGANTSLFNYREYASPRNLCPYVSNNTCFGRLELPGSYEIGFVKNASGHKSYWGKVSPFAQNEQWIHEATTSEYIRVKAKEVVTTKRGKFETFALEVIIDEVGAGINITYRKSINGTFWVHPAVGIVKADYVLKEGEFSTYDVTYELDATNLPY